MPGPFIPKIEYANPTITLELTQPQKLWTPSIQSIGGSNVSDAGVPETFIIRRDQLVNVEVRFTEAEWDAVADWLEWAQEGVAFYYWFNGTDITTRYSVYLQSPNLGDGEIQPTRDTYRGVFSVRLVLRSATGTRFDVRTQD